MFDSVDGVDLSKYFITSPTRGMLYPGDKPTAVQTTFKAEQELTIKEQPVLKCQVCLILCAYQCVYTHVYKYIFCMYVCMHVCVSVCMHACYIHMQPVLILCACQYVCVCACVNVYVCVSMCTHACCIHIQYLYCCGTDN